MSNCIVILVICLCLPSSLARGSGPPCTMNYATWGSEVNMTLTNYGILGSAQDPNVIDPETGEPAPSCQFPSQSGLEYLFQGSIWIGAIVNGDTLVSCGTDGWWDTHEMFPDPCPDGEMELIIDDDHREILGEYYDTCVTFAETDPIDNRPLIPIGLKINVHSYSWFDHPFNDFVILRFNLKNIGVNAVEDAWVGYYWDGDVHHEHNTYSGAQDDIAGFIDMGDLKYAYIMDNDGDPDGENWDYASVRSVCGILLLKPEQHGLTTTFNWWISSVNSQYDWGPQWQDNYDGPFPGGGKGTPGGDAARYRVMSNGEHDYDQLYAAIDYSGGGPQGKEWIAPLQSNLARDIANGYDTRFLISFGPIESISPGESYNFDIAVVAGENLHANPTDFADLFYGQEDNPVAIEEFYNSLDFTDLIANAENALLYTGVDDDDRTVPAAFSLYQNYPNPFNAETRINYIIPKAAHVKLSIYNLLGQEIAAPVNERQLPGVKSYHWDASEYSSGIYFYKLAAGDKVFTKRMTLLK